MSDNDSDWLQQFLAALAKVPTPTPGAPFGAPLGAPLAAPLAANAQHEATAVAAPEVTIAPVLPTTAIPGFLLTADLLRKLGAHDADAWAPPLAEACARHAITTPRRLAAFLANVLVESGNMATLVENLNYSSEALLAQWPKRFTRASAQALGRNAAHKADQRGIAEAAYGGRLGNGPTGSGDGWLFRGRGLIQLTGRANYARFVARIGMQVSELPAFLETRTGAAESAAAFWATVGCNAAAEAGDIDRVRLLVNGGTIGLEHVRTRYRSACQALGVAP